MSAEYKAWPYEQAQAILEKLEAEQKAVGERKRTEVLLETGFGPSGLPHIGTFGEVARTTYVAQALREMSEHETVIFAFSDDMDGFRGIPDTVADPEPLIEHLGKPLSDVPDPFGDEDSFAGYANMKLREFLDSFDFDYVFKSSKDQYRGGVFNDGLERIVDTYDAVRERCVRELSEENAATWSPFKPICEKCGKVNTTRVDELHTEDYTISYSCSESFNAKIPGEHGERKTVEVSGCGYEGRMSVLDGNVKLGWKVDWALRWYVFGVDYEMYGKDLIDSATVSSDLVRILGGEPPAGMHYEWFNDENNESISKTKGNGVTIDEWLRYGPIESLSYLIYDNPQKAKRLFFGMIPRTIDKYLDFRKKYGEASGDEERVNNPAHFVEAARIAARGKVAYDSELQHNVLLNLINVLDASDPEIVWAYVERYEPGAREKDEDLIHRMIVTGIQYYQDFLAGAKDYQRPADQYIGPVRDFLKYLEEHPEAGIDDIQTMSYQVAKDHGIGVEGSKRALRKEQAAWFRALYQLLVGQPEGPRIGTFVHLFGREATIELIERNLDA